MAYWKYTKRRIDGKLTRVKVKRIGDRTLVRKVNVKNYTDRTARPSYKRKRRRAPNYFGL